MFIVIEDDVFEDIDKIQDPFDIKIRAIDALFDSMYRGKHVVYCSVKNLITIKNNNIFGLRTQKFVMWLLKEYTRVYSCKEIVTTYISISGEYKSVKFNKAFF